MFYISLWHWKRVKATALVQSLRDSLILTINCINIHYNIHQSIPSVNIHQVFNESVILIRVMWFWKMSLITELIKESFLIVEATIRPPPSEIQEKELDVNLLVNMEDECQIEKKKLDDTRKEICSFEITPEMTSTLNPIRLTVVLVILQIIILSLALMKL